MDPIIDRFDMFSFKHIDLGTNRHISIRTNANYCSFLIFGLIPAGHPVCAIVSGSQLDTTSRVCSINYCNISNYTYTNKFNISCQNMTIILEALANYYNLNILGIDRMIITISA